MDKNNIGKESDAFKIDEDGTIIRGNDNNESPRKSKQRWIIGGVAAIILVVIGILLLNWYNEEQTVKEHTTKVNEHTAKVIELTGKDRTFWLSYHIFMAGENRDNSFHLFEDCPTLNAYATNKNFEGGKRGINYGRVEDVLKDKGYTTTMCVQCEDRAENKDKTTEKKLTQKTQVEEQKQGEGRKISGQIGQRQIEDEMDFIYVYWNFEDKGRKPIIKSKINNGKFSFMLPAIPQRNLKTPNDFFENSLEVSNTNARIGSTYLFAYSSVFSEFSGDLYPQGKSGVGSYIYADDDVNITGKSSQGIKLSLQLKKGWNSIVETYNDEREWTVKTIPNEWEWDS